MGTGRRMHGIRHWAKNFPVLSNLFWKFGRWDFCVSWALWRKSLHWYLLKCLAVSKILSFTRKNKRTDGQTERQTLFYIVLKIIKIFTSIFISASGPRPGETKERLEAVIYWFPPKLTDIPVLLESSSSILITSNLKKKIINIDCIFCQAKD